MFNFFTKESRLDKNAYDRQFDAHMAQVEAQDKLYSLARNCKKCQDIGILAVAVRRMDDPNDEVFIEYMRCSCECSINPNVSDLMNND